MAVPLAHDSRGYSYRLFAALAEQGWRPTRFPTNGRLPTNRQLIHLETNEGEERCRLLIYKITQSSRGLPYERRIEATSTYAGGSLRRLPGYQDALLGYDETSDVFVGFDVRRLEHGGATQNASSFFSIDGLNLANEREIHVIGAASGIFGTEYHAFFRPARFAEYIFNSREIHAGGYRGAGRFSLAAQAPRPRVDLQVEEEFADGDVLALHAPSARASRQRIRPGDVRAFERSDLRARLRTVTPAEFERLRQYCEENGRLGEQHVVAEERQRLHRAGRNDLAQLVRWVSQESVSQGYDIDSFETDGQHRFIEVKATSGTGRPFEMSLNEWATATRLGARYCVARVTSVRTSPTIAWFGDLLAAEAEGRLSRTASGWLVTIR